MTVLIGLLATGAGMSASGFQEGDLDGKYVCIVDGLYQNEVGVMDFDRTSGTEYSGYPYAGTTKSAVRCGTSANKGTWKDLTWYAKSIGLDPYDILIEDNEADQSSGYVGARQQQCAPPPEGCGNWTEVTE